MKQALPRYRIALIVILSPLFQSCVTGPNLPPALEGQSLIVLGFTTNQSKPYENGTLFTGFHINKLDGKLIKPAMTMYNYRIVEPGLHTIEGHCYWQLRSALNMNEDDLLEPATLTLKTKPDYRYTIQSDIDEYKARCNLMFVETDHHSGKSLNN